MSTTTTAQVWTIDGKPVPHEVYHGDTTMVSNSAKEVFRKSQRLYYGRYVACNLPPSEETLALRIGTMAHIALWEPDLWLKYVPEMTLGPDGSKLDRRKKDHKAHAEAFAAACVDGGLTTVDGAELWLVNDLVSAARAHAIAGRLVNADGPTERSIVWTDEETGIDCKCRQDKFVTGSDLIVDLKTSDDVSPEGFAKMAAQRGYHRQADFYLKGHHALTGDVARFLFLLVSKTTFEVALYELDDESLNLGHRQNAATMKALAACRESGDWLATHEKQITTLSLPGWAFTQSDWELSNG